MITFEKNEKNLSIVAKGSEGKVIASQNVETLLLYDIRYLLQEILTTLEEREE